MATDEDGFTEVQSSHTAPATTGETPVFAKENDPNLDPNYAAILKKLQGYHTELLGIDNLADNPVEAGQYQGKIRLEVSRLFAWMNAYIDLQVSVSEDYAHEKAMLYKQGLAQGKTPSAAEKHASEMTRVKSANLAIAKLRVDQIKNEYERYNGIAIYLATRMKEFNTERTMG